MKKCIPIFFNFFFMVFACHAFAKTVALTTVYPAPTSAYNQLNLAPKPVTITCGTSNNGTIFADSTGTLHVCNNGVSSNYPQECYNIFCSYDKSIYSLTTSSCSPYTATIPNVCPSGFTQTAISSTAPQYYDTFQTSTNTVVVYAACCSQ
jgi:hypothetical protein